MYETIVTVLVWFSALASGLMAGLYFAFSSFIMRALGGVEPTAGIAAMNAINLTIVRSAFLPLFLGSTLVAAVLAVIGIVDRETPHALPMLAGGAIYVVGMFGVTMARNVPLNDALAKVDPASGEGSALWRRYLGQWTRWNHLRTLASLAACALHVRTISLV